MRENTFSKIIGAPWTGGTVKIEVDKVIFSLLDSVYGTSWNTLYWIQLVETGTLDQNRKTK